MIQSAAQKIVTKMNVTWKEESKAVEWSFATDKSVRTLVEEDNVVRSQEMWFAVDCQMGKIVVRKFHHVRFVKTLQALSSVVKFLTKKENALTGQADKYAVR